MAKKKSKTRKTKSKPTRTKAKESVKRVAKPANRAMTKAKAQATTQAPPKPTPGAFVWHELMTTDVARAKTFYSNVFGWKLKDEEMMPGFIYTTAANKGEPVGGMMAIAPEQGDIKPHWMVYIAVKNVDVIAEQTEALGGEIVVPPHDIPVGRWALLKDPTGAAFAVYRRSNR